MLFIQISAFYSCLNSRQLGTGLYPKVSSATPAVLFGDPGELRISECEFVPVPDWLMGILLRGSSGKIHLALTQLFAE